MADETAVARTDCPFRDLKETIIRVDDPVLMFEQNTPVDGPVSTSSTFSGISKLSDSIIAYALSTSDESWLESESITATCRLLLGTKVSGT
jgi:hypothetical protein